jgi:hypothetical protein
MRDKVTPTWGERLRPIPPGALHVNRIREGVGIDLDDKELLEKHYLELREDKVHFENPDEENAGPTAVRCKERHHRHVDA